jgi:hypothetical protein
MKVVKSINALEKLDNVANTPLSPSPSTIKIGQEGVAESWQRKNLSQEGIKTTENTTNYFFLAQDQKHEDKTEALLVPKADNHSSSLKAQVGESEKLNKAEQLESEENYAEEFLSRYLKVEDMSSTYQTERESALNYLRTHWDQIDVNYDEGLFIIYAAQNNDIEMVQLLLEHGINQSLLDALGQAGVRGYKEIAKILIEFLKKQGMSDFSHFRYTTAYTNHPETRALFNEELKKTHPHLVKL